MAVLSLIEAAEQAATSKIDVWRAIQEGALPAQKTNDGGYAIDQTDLFRVFERKQPEPRLSPPDLSPAPDEAPAAKVDEAPEPDAASEVSRRFRSPSGRAEKPARLAWRGVPRERRRAARRTQKALGR